jgi:hypothetical protein
MRINDSFIPVPPVPPMIGIGHSFPIPVSGGKTVFDGADYGSGRQSFDIDGAAARVVAAYDSDGSGGIDTNAETNRYSGGNEASIDRLAKYADAAGNHDGVATAKEIASAIRRFDTDTSGASAGRLTGSERRTFLNVFGEESHPIYFHHMRRPGMYQGPDWAQPTPSLDVTFGLLHPYVPSSGPSEHRLDIKRDLGNEVRSR